MKNSGRKTMKKTASKAVVVSSLTGNIRSSNIIKSKDTHIKGKKEVKGNAWGDTMTKAEWEHFSRMEDKDIDLSDIPALGKAFWEKAVIVMPKRKKAISLRVDMDIWEWFKKYGKGYQSLMNAVLRSYYELHGSKK